MKYSIETKNLRKSFKGHLSLSTHKVLRGVDLKVPDGGIFGFLGPNGAGKTTTIKIIIGLLFADEGDVTLMGKPLGDTSVREKVGFLPEAPYFYDYLTGLELLGFMGSLCGLKGAVLGERVRNLLETVGLKDKGKVQLRKYSKGMLQRIGVAQALVNDPDLVILDEPMTGLDPLGRREMRDLILSLKARGKTIFFSSHILADAESICDRVAILVQGKVVEEGLLEKLLGSKVNFWDVTLKTDRELDLPEAHSVLIRRGSRSLLRVEDEVALNNLLRVALESGAEIEAVVPHKASLEDIFIARISEDGGRI